MVKQVKTRQNGRFMELSHQARSQLINTKDADKPAEEDKRSYTVRKIKGTGKLSIKILIPSRLDLAKAEKKVENGLLTVKIPVSEKPKTIEFAI